MQVPMLDFFSARGSWSIMAGKVFKVEDPYKEYRN